MTETAPSAAMTYHFGFLSIDDTVIVQRVDIQFSFAFANEELLALGPPSVWSGLMRVTS
jgi:hypothetical protein